MKFSIVDIHKATGNFSTANQIGQGGFGTVYKGVLMDGTLVAVKRAKKVRNILSKFGLDSNQTSFLRFPLLFISFS